MPKDKAEEEIFAMFENTKMENTRSYLGRGRPLETESSNDLTAKWTEQITALADAMPKYDRQTMDDCEAELGLRGIEAPANQIPQDVMKRLISRSKARTDGWSAEEIERAEGRLQRELDKVRPTKRDKN